jgi:hypothetical protein
MSRAVEVKNVVAGAGSLSSGAGGKGDVNDWLERTAKYVPSEVIAAYVAAEGFAEPAVGQRRIIWHAVIFFACLLITPFYIAKFASTTKAKWVNAVVASVSFVIWSYSVGHFFRDIDWYDAIGAPILLVLWTLATGLIQPTEKQTPPPAASLISQPARVNEKGT